MRNSRTKGKLLKPIRKIKRLLIYIGELCRLPHIFTTIILLVIAIVTIMFSKHCYQQQDMFLSSVLSNVFAGLVTGIAICLISGTKNIFNYKMKKKRDFLLEVHSDCLAFLNAYKEMIRKAGKANKSRDDLYNEIYDVLCKGNDIDGKISQSQFDKTLPFNPYRFFVRRLDYDAIKQMEANNLLRDNVLSLDVDAVTHKELIDMFKDMYDSVFLLNGRVLSKIRELDIRKNISGRFII